MYIMYGLDQLPTMGVAHFLLWAPGIIYHLHAVFLYIIKRAYYSFVQTEDVHCKNYLRLVTKTHVQIKFVQFH